MSWRPNLPRRNLLAICYSLGGVTLLAWVYLFYLADTMSNMQGMTSMSAMQIPVWDARYFLMMFLMWGVMMVGMMLPSVAPTVLLYAAVAKNSEAQGVSAGSTPAFVSGYIFVWIGFSLLATALQWGLDRTALLSPMMVLKSPAIGAGLLALAGVYQWLPQKRACLDHCRSPAHFISSHWRSGSDGAFIMGISHGVFCLGCCWALMMLLFVGGVMNLLWIALITIFVLLEKLLPAGPSAGRWMGLVMIVSGIALLLISS